LFSLVPIGGALLSGLISLFLLGYDALFLQSILHASMQGEDRIPAWPEIGGLADLFEDLLSIVAPFPGFILESSMPAFSETSPLMVALSLLFLVAGWLYVPLAILVWTIYGGWSIFNPVAVAKAAWQTGPSYLGLAATVPTSPPSALPCSSSTPWWWLHGCSGCTIAGIDRRWDGSARRRSPPSPARPSQNNQDAL
jgi:hypothetical protein